MKTPADLEGWVRIYQHMLCATCVKFVLAADDTVKQGTVSKLHHVVLDYETAQLNGPIAAAMQALHQLKERYESAINTSEFSLGEHYHFTLALERTSRRKG